MLYIFGVFLVYSGIKIFFEGEEDEIDPGKNPILKFARKHLKITKGDFGGRFMVRKGGSLLFTPLFLVIILIETTDLIFAVDSIPAAFAITQSEFIIYIGSHGDKGADIADVILPGAAYTEQDGHYINLEGKIQKAHQASYPPGEAKEDWEIINDLSKLLKRKKLYNEKHELIDSMFNYLKLKKEIKDSYENQTEFLNEKIVIDPNDYYYSNVIARASKTMNECRNEKIKGTGTEG